MPTGAGYNPADYDAQGNYIGSGQGLMTAQMYADELLDPGSTAPPPPADTSMYAAPIEAQYQPGGANYLPPYDAGAQYGAATGPSSYEYAPAPAPTDPYNSTPPGTYPSDPLPTQTGGFSQADLAYRRQPQPEQSEWWRGNPFDAVGGFFGGMRDRFTKSSFSAAASPVPPPANAAAVANNLNQTFVGPLPPIEVRPVPDWGTANWEPVFRGRQVIGRARAGQVGAGYRRGYSEHPVERNHPGFAVSPAPPVGTITQMLGGRYYPMSQAHTEEEDRRKGEHFHGGVDIGVPVGTPFSMPSTQGGTVVAVQDANTPAALRWTNPGIPPYNYSNATIRLDDGTEMVVTHLNTTDVRPGQRLQPGQVIGETGSVMDRRALAGAPGHVHLGLLRYDADGNVVDELDPVVYFGEQALYGNAPQHGMYGDWRIAQREFDTIGPGDYAPRQPTVADDPWTPGIAGPFAPPPPPPQSRRGGQLRRIS